MTPIRKTGLKQLFAETLVLQVGGRQRKRTGQKVGRTGPGNSGWAAITHMPQQVGKKSLGSKPIEGCSCFPAPKGCD